MDGTESDRGPASRQPRKAAFNRRQVEAGKEHDFARAAIDQSLDLPLQKRLAADLQERLGLPFREGK